VTQQGFSRSPQPKLLIKIKILLVGNYRADIKSSEREQEHYNLPFLHLMATHIVSWGGNEHLISPVPSSTPSIVSVDSVLSHERETSSTVHWQEATGPAPESLAERMSSLLAEPSGSETSTSASTHQRADTADDSFTRHHKYFFKDGNVTFLVRGV
jgi:hypothetical protein